MAADWGQLPGVVLRLPWVQLRRWLEIAARRHRRQMKIAASVNGLAAFGGGATPEPPRNVDPDVVNAALEAQLFAAGIPIADF